MTDDVIDAYEVAKYIGYSNLNGVSVWASRRGIKALYKKPGHKGVNVYARSDIETGKRNMPGQGVRTKKTTG